MAGFDTGEIDEILRMSAEQRAQYAQSAY
jgi:hypothetical protein